MQVPDSILYWAASASLNHGLNASWVVVCLCWESGCAAFPEYQLDFLSSFCRLGNIMNYVAAALFQICTSLPNRGEAVGGAGWGCGWAWSRLEVERALILR